MVASWTRRVLKKASGPTKSASARSRTSAANAASMSRLLLALRICSCTPMLWAAACTSLRTASARVASVGLMSAARRAAPGTSSCNSARRLATTTAVRKFTPVALPPGRPMLATRPRLTGSSTTPKTIGMGRGSGFCRACAGRGARHGNYRNPTADQIGYQFHHAIVLPVSPAIFDRDVLTFHKSGFVETFAEGGQIEPIVVERTDTEKSDHRHRRLLRVRRERPHRRAAEERHELAPSQIELHSVPSHPEPDCRIPNWQWPVSEYQSIHSGVGLGRAMSESGHQTSRGRTDRR